SYLELTVPPACLLIPDSIPVLRSLHFSMQGRQLQNQEEQIWRWTMEEPRFENAGLKLKMGKNAVGGLFTMLTGVGTDKVTETQYNALVNIYDVASQTAYRFTVPYILEEREDRERTRTRQADGTRLTSTETTGQVRSNFTIDGNRPGYLLANADTIARFNLRFSLRVPVAQPDAYWDGTDSSTLTNLPKHWGNQGLKMPFQITGQLQGKYFEANSMYDEEVLDLNFDKKLVARVRTTQNRPVHALIYEELPIELWKPLFYFASLPLGQGR
ncbi:MAG TPA: hypothetical protein PKD90_03790, partial [Phnomibacter sp.]|nr:hypothetical protein [Phnomibacter sp.]